MKLSSRLFLACLLLCCSRSFGAEPPPSTSEKLLAEVRRILSAAKESEYQHTTKVDEPAGKFLLDCSGLIDYALKRVSPEHLKVIEKHRQDKRPLAWDFVQTFTAAPADAKKARRGWQRIEHIADARAGDVLAWQNPKKVEGDGQDTGHVMMIDADPLAVEKPDEAAPGGKLYRVRIIDSTKSGHADDSRKAAQTGVGRGTLWIVADADGKPIGYHWKNKEAKARLAEIAIGRAVGAE